MKALARNLAVAFAANLLILVAGVPAFSGWWWACLAALVVAPRAMRNVDIDVAVMLAAVACACAWIAWA